MVHIIVAIDRKGGIGRGGDLLFHLRDDLRRFKALTMGNTLVMGRRTFESLPGGALPGRRNIVITRQPDYRAEGAEVAPSLDEALRLAAEGNPEEIMIIGGGQVYEAAVGISHRIYLTEVCGEYPDADTFFPRLDFGQWVVEEASEPLTDAASGLGYRFLTLRRR